MCLPRDSGDRTVTHLHIVVLIMSCVIIVVSTVTVFFKILSNSAVLERDLVIGGVSVRFRHTL